MILTIFVGYLCAGIFLICAIHYLIRTFYEKSEFYTIIAALCMAASSHYFDSVNIKFIEHDIKKVQEDVLKIQDRIDELENMSGEEDE